MKVYPEHKQLVMAFRPDVENILLPAAKRFQAGGRWWLAIPHEIDTVRVLRNLGLAAPSPLPYYYDWCGGVPFDSQRVTAEMLTLSPRAYLLSEMGVGKTRAALWAYDYLRLVGKVAKLVVLAPLSTLVTVWQNEIFENFPHLQTQVLYGSKEKRLRRLGAFADVYIINHDGVEVIHSELFKRTDINAAIIDELAVYRSTRTDRWKFAKPIVQRADYAWGLTGNCTPNEPTDAFGQIRLLTPERVGYSFTRFRDETMRQITQFKWVPRTDSNEKVHMVMQPSIRFTRDQCFDLPETTYSTRAIRLDPKAQGAYKKMFDELAIQVKAKEITAANEGVKLSKLLQLSAGFVYDGDREGQYIGGLDRIREILGCIHGSSNKVIVFAPFRYLVELIGGVVKHKYATEIVHGDVPTSERIQIFSCFQKSDSPRVLVAHPACMAHGLTLTAADTIIWAAPVTSLEIYEQANARITRSGQKNHTHIIHMQGSVAEKYVYDRLRRKAKMQGALLEMFAQQSQELTA